LNLAVTLVHNILKKINPKLNSFKIPKSIKLFQIVKRIENRDFLILFRELDILQIYKNAFDLLGSYINSPSAFLESEKVIKDLVYEWKKSIQIRSSYI